MKPPANPDLPIQSDASLQDPSALAEYQHDESEFEEMNKKRETFEMERFCHHVARMELFYSLRPQLKEYHTLKGRLVFSGVDYIEPNTYSKRYAWLGDAVNLLLKELLDEIEHYVDQYRKDLRKQERLTS